ncbi:MAG: hypothetical protein RL223_199 [Pseudomonadota bacterium]
MAAEPGVRTEAPQHARSDGAAAPPRPDGGDWIAGWDIGGAHVKLALLHQGRLQQVWQWACPLWQSLDRLHAVLAEAVARLPAGATVQHALTMSGEMADLFPDRLSGVRAITAALDDALRPTTAPRPDTATPATTAADTPDAAVSAVSAVSADAAATAPVSAAVAVWAGQRGWLRPSAAAAAWDDVASANWLASAQWAARALPGPGLLVDIGSTTTDLVAWRAGRVLGDSRRDVDRLACGELVYHGVVRTPLCALGPQAPWQGRPLNLMNEFFATSADVYRLTGELDERHDQQPAADQGPKTVAASRARLARMIGLDAADGTPAQWEALARHFRQVQLATMATSLRQVWQRHALPADAPVLAVGCGRFLLPDLLRQAGLTAARPVAAAGLTGLSTVATPADAPGATGPAEVAGHPPMTADERIGWALVALPAVAVASLRAQALSRPPAPPRPHATRTTEDARCG